MYFCHAVWAEGGSGMRFLLRKSKCSLRHREPQNGPTPIWREIHFVKYFSSSNIPIQNGNNKNTIRIYIYIYTNLLFKSLSNISLSFESHMMFSSPRLSMVSSFNILNVNSPCTDSRRGPSSKVPPASLLRPPPLHGRGLEVGRKSTNIVLVYPLVN